jgi:choline dehydrogenase-like flavoprotein
MIPIGSAFQHEFYPLIEQALQDTHSPYRTMKRARVAQRDAFAAYLRPVLAARPNLVLRTGVSVTSVVVNGDVAAGVTFFDHGLEKRVLCRREVILAAGTYVSPKLLMLSGLGPRKELEKWNVTVKRDLPAVGQNVTFRIAAPVINAGTRVRPLPCVCPLCSFWCALLPLTPY